MSPEWERAEIQYRIMEDHYSGAYSGPGYGASLQFFARAWNDQGSYRAAESLKLPIALPAGASRMPQQGNPQHKSLHHELVEKLRRDGWEQRGERGAHWWQLRFRRPYQPRPGWWERLRCWLVGDR